MTGTRGNPRDSSVTNSPMPGGTGNMWWQARQVTDGYSLPGHGCAWRSANRLPVHGIQAGFCERVGPRGRDGGGMRMPQRFAVLTLAGLLSGRRRGD